MYIRQATENISVQNRKKSFLSVAILKLKTISSKYLKNLSSFAMRRKLRKAWTGFYMIKASVMKELKAMKY